MHSPSVDFTFIQHCQQNKRLLLIRQTKTHLRHYVDAFVAASEGQVEHRAASIGHRRRLQLQHQIGAVGLS